MAKMPGSITPSRAGIPPPFLRTPGRTSPWPGSRHGLRGDCPAQRKRLRQADFSCPRLLDRRQLQRVDRRSRGQPRLGLPLPRPRILCTRTRRGPMKQQRKLALEEIMIAEGSDWNWWYGPEHHSANDREFDELYRKHLSNVYQALGAQPPDYLAQSILGGASRPFVHASDRLHPPPRDRRYGSLLSSGWAPPSTPPTAGPAPCTARPFLLDSVYAGIDAENSMAAWILPARVRAGVGLGGERGILGHRRAACAARLAPGRGGEGGEDCQSWKVAVPGEAAPGDREAAGRIKLNPIRPKEWRWRWAGSSSSSFRSHALPGPRSLLPWQRWSGGRRPLVPQLRARSACASACGRIACPWMLCRSKAGSNCIW
jgi:hypothetical protein